MRILFTGASSFTGMWFVQELAAAGHEVHAPLLHARHDYKDIRGLRVERIAACATLYDEIPFGSDPFFELINSNSWDLFCHHAADVTDYKNPHFDYAKALANNTRSLDRVIDALQKQGCSKILLTGTVFEQNEGEGTDHLRAVSPYGLSKGLTSAVFDYYAAIKPIKLGKFVIPNPFGPFEEYRFTSFLAQAWLSGQCAPVSSPDYVRDNIPVTLLAKAYCRFAEQLTPEPGFSKLNPSGYCGTQGEFTALFAEALRPRLHLKCAYELLTQVDFNEPLKRINTDILDPQTLDWDEERFWDHLADYYKEIYDR